MAAAPEPDLSQFVRNPGLCINTTAKFAVIGVATNGGATLPTTAGTCSSATQQQSKKNKGGKKEKQEGKKKGKAAPAEEKVEVEVDEAAVAANYDLVHARTQTRHAQRRTYTQARTHMHTQSRSSTNMRTHTHTRARARPHTHTHTRAPTRARTGVLRRRGVRHTG